MEITLRTAEFEDSRVIAQMLNNLAIDIGDTDHYKGNEYAISQHGFGPEKLFHCVVAEDENTTVGFAIYFSTFSTTRGEPGVYLQDLWVSKAFRGKGVANKLIKQVSRVGSELWGATHMTLTVYNDNLSALKFYKSTGFKIGERERQATLGGASFQGLIE